ncbi:hypothetical protein [Streptomyces termitum]|uniref:hypothetical protein n=1 Tax=Streptomyces termitum TaxID=67368 RepID=UPI003799888D
MSGTESGRGRRTALVATVAAGVLLAGGGGVYLTASASGGGDGDGTASRAAGAPAAPSPGLGGGSGGTAPGAGIAPGEPDPGGARGTVYRAEGPLPQGPSSAAVHRPKGLVTSQEVAGLAGVLGLGGRTPVRVGDVWTIRPEKDGRGPRLDVSVRAPGDWSFSWYDGGPAGDTCLKGKACPPPGEARPPAGGPVSEAAARAAAAPVLKALGQEDAKVSAGQVLNGSVRVVNADPVVDGLPTYGWATGLHIGPDGRPVAGSGTLKEPVRGETARLVPAERALARLNETSRGRIPDRVTDCATDPPAAEPGTARAPGEGSPCFGAGTPVKPLEVPVTGAVLGLAARDSAEGRLLVPSWLFTADPADAAPYTVTSPALVEENLPPAATPSARAPEPPAADGTAPVAPRITSYAVAADGRTVSLVFWGGVCSTYTAHTSEEPGRVRVRIDERSDPDAVCVALAKEITAEVVLKAPLGDRPVLDEASGRPVPRR